MINTRRFIQWMNVVRELSGDQQFRVLESFWESQITSKFWLLDKMQLFIDKENVKNVYIFGGWYGVLGGLIHDIYSNSNVFSIDIDPDTKKIGERMNPDINFEISDMAKYNIPSDASLIINTSTEHVSQNTFDIWYSTLPNSVPIILQGNDFFSCQEHVRSTETLEEFLKLNKLNKLFYTGSLNCNQFNRFMSMGTK